MSTGVQITLIICITFLLLNKMWVREGESKKEFDSASPPKPKIPPIPGANPSPKSSSPGVPEKDKSVAYEIFTKDDYKRYMLSTTKGMNITKEYAIQIDEVFAKISKGYNFIVGTGQGDTLMFYGPEYFNNEVLGGKTNES